MLENSTRAGSYEFQHWKGQQNWCFIFSTSLHCSVVKGAPNSVRNVYSEKYWFFFPIWGNGRSKTFLQTATKLARKYLTSGRFMKDEIIIWPKFTASIFPWGNACSNVQTLFFNSAFCKNKITQKKRRQRENNAQSAYASKWFKNKGLPSGKLT